VLTSQILDEVKVKSTKYGVVAIGRNEELGVGKCLQSVLDQTIKPEKIIFVNDGSVDNTKKIAESIPGIEVVEFGEEHETWVDSENLSRIVNKGILKIGEIEGVDFIITMGGDTILPKNYAEVIISKMLKHPEIVVASGKVNGEFSHIPRGTARVTNLKYWKMIGLGYKTKIGFEGYHVIKAASMGLGHRVFDIEITSSKKTGAKYSAIHWYNEGKSCKALGYSTMYVIGRSIMMALRKDVHGGFDLLMGFFENNYDFYENEVREYVRKTQNHLILHKPKEILKRILRRT